MGAILLYLIFNKYVNVIVISPWLSGLTDLKLFTDIMLIIMTSIWWLYMCLFALISHVQSNRDKMSFLVNALLNSNASGAKCQTVYLLVSAGDVLQSMTKPQQGAGESIVLIPRATTPVKSFHISIVVPLSHNSGGDMCLTLAMIRESCLSKLAKMSSRRIT